jgi:hypothetical protein
MNSFMDSKAMAKALRSSLAERNIELSHSACLELVARQFGFADWNVLSAQIEATKTKLQPLSMPAGWFPTSFTDPKLYRAGLDATMPGCALIESIANRQNDLGNKRFACLMQSIDAQQYLGEKIRLTAALRCEDADCGTIWMRIDGIERPSIRFDNMLSRDEHGPISGTTGWSSRSIVLEVPLQATSIHYGFFLKGYGKLWARSFALEVVPNSVADTDIASPPGEQKTFPIQPSNLDFANNGV